MKAARSWWGSFGEGCRLVLAGTLGAVCFFLAGGSALAQAGPQQGGEESHPLWEAKLPGGSIVLVRSAITSLARSTYVVDGTLRVHEVSVGMTGSVQALFYYTEPVQPRSPVGAGQSALDDLRGRLNEVTHRVGAGEVESAVTKSFPQTTHAHTVEFRLPSLAQLDRLQAHLERWFVRRGSGAFSLDAPATAP